MAGRIRCVILTLLTVGLAFALTACMGQWFAHEQSATLIIGDMVISGNRGEVLISIVNMPDQGLASIGIADQGIGFADIKAASIEVEGLNGFTIASSDFSATTNKGCLVATNITSGNEAGTILKVTFEANGPNPTFTVDKTKVSIWSALNTLITTWDLNTDTSYYAK